MKCPRCGVENPISEATQQRCLNCGFLLFGEISEHRDLRRSARRTLALQIVILLIVIAGLAVFAWSKNWFGLVGRDEFQVSDNPETIPLIGGGIAYLTVNESKVPFSREATWNVDAILLGQQVYDDELSPAAKRDVFIVWGPAAAIRLNSIRGGLHDRTGTVTAPEELIEPDQLDNSVAILHLASNNSGVERLLAGAKPGARLSVSGFVLSGTISGTRYGIPPSTPTEQVRSWLIEVTGLSVNGRTSAESG
ncbi:MAG: hypothetical protein HY420_00480 [Candidatus Kerfeldbacteria bacterium]|nr:hypothetical protein [Candidatus Kerfeldbacteria bacterium]